ncbi:hypothetical protein LTS10_004329 [Elasticomyces elasticus]|nr:hypothetical protein LTS10_004329 [Elasticomyces elasticus]
MSSITVTVKKAFDHGIMAQLMQDHAGAYGSGGLVEAYAQAAGLTVSELQAKGKDYKFDTKIMNSLIQAYVKEYYDSGELAKDYVASQGGVISDYIIQPFEEFGFSASAEVELY